MDIVVKLTGDHFITRYDDATGWVAADMLDHLSKGAESGTVQWFAVLPAGIPARELIAGVKRALSSDAGHVNGIRTMPAPQPRKV